MSRRSAEIAREHGRGLPAFPSQAMAEAALFALRDRRLALFRQWAVDSGRFSANGKPESLKAIEAWYFDMAISDGPAANKEDLDAALGAYVGLVLVESAGFEWIVEQDAFVPGRFGFGVRKGLFTLMLTNGMSPDPLERNRRKQSLFRQYQKYAA